MANNEFSNWGFRDRRLQQEPETVRPDSSSTASFLRKRAMEVEDSVGEYMELEDQGVIKALYMVVKDQNNPALKAMAKRLKAYLDGGFDDPVTLELDPETDQVKITY